MRVAAIVCPGPSLDPSMVPTLHEQSEIVVACNRGFKAWAEYPNLHPDALYLMDGPHAFKDCIKELRALDTLFFVRGAARMKRAWREAGVTCPVMALTISEQSSVEGVNPFPQTLLSGPCKTTVIAWQHLIRMGFDRIGIAGCDCRVDPTQRYFFPSKPLTEPERRRQFISYGGILECFRHWVPHAEALGVQTVNLSGRGSALFNIIPSIEPSEITKWTAQQN